MGDASLLATFRPSSFGPPPHQTTRREHVRNGSALLHATRYHFAGLRFASGGSPWTGNMKKVLS